MAIVIEVLNRAGHVISVHKFGTDRVVIGRGLNADLTLHDPHLDARHCVIDRSVDTHNLYCEDAQSLNGVWQLFSRKPGYGITFKNKTRLGGKTLFYSGQQFLLGRTVLRVYAADHPVVAPLPMSRWEELGHGLSHWAVWLGAMLAIIVSQSLDAFLANPTQDNVLQYVLPSGYALIAAAAYAGLWAFVGRNLRHEGRFATHFSVALLAILALACIEWLMPFVVYNLRLWWAQAALDTVFTALLTFVVGLSTLLYATHLKPLVRALVALVIPMAMLLSTAIGALTEPDFSAVPPYETALVAPHWQLRQGVVPETFMAQAKTLFATPTEETSTEE